MGLMAFLYMDDSKHDQYAFSLGAFVISDTDLSEPLKAIYTRHGYDIERFEYKSSALMYRDIRRRDLRSSLQNFLVRNCQVALCISSNGESLGSASLELLKHTLQHPMLVKGNHQVFFDEGLFRSRAKAHALVDEAHLGGTCHFHFEQDSKSVLGIQLADLAAHCCSTMLLHQLGHYKKTVSLNMPRDEIYHGLCVDLGWELWAKLRYCFLSQNKPEPWDEDNFAFVDVYPWGLHVDETVDPPIRLAAMKQFGEIYLGCIH